MNIQHILRLHPCRALAAGGNSSECIPAPDIIDPVAVNSAARAKQIAEAALHNPGSETSAHDWRTAQISTTGNRHYKPGQTFRLRFADGSDAVGVIGQVQISCNGATVEQQLIVNYLG